MTAEDEAAAAAVIRSNHLSGAHNTHVADFEEKLSAHFGGSEVRAVSTGTAAVHLALLALGVGPHDEVVVPSYTFIGSVSPILYCGATPVFADVDPATHCMRADDLHDAIGERTKAVVVVHLNGFAAPIAEILEIAAARSVPVVEDCAQALGTTVDGQPAGTLGTISCFSFYEQKVITSGGEGGAVVTRRPDLAAKVTALRSHGEQSDGDRFLWCSELGFNYRMTAIQATIGVAQLKRLASFVEQRRANAALLDTALAEVPDAMPATEIDGTRSSYWKYPVRLAPDVNAVAVIDLLRDGGLPTMLRYPYPVDHQPAFAAYRTRANPEAAALARSTITLPVHPGLSTEMLLGFTSDLDIALRKCRNGA